MKLLLITGPPVLNLCVVSLVVDEWPSCAQDLIDILLPFPSSHIHECLTLRADVTDTLASMFQLLFSASVLLGYKETSGAPRRIIKHQSKT